MDVITQLVEHLEASKAEGRSQAPAAGGLVRRYELDGFSLDDGTQMRLEPPMKVEVRQVGDAQWTRIMGIGMPFLQCAACSDVAADARAALALIWQQGVLGGSVITDRQAVALRDMLLERAWPREAS